MYNNNKHLNMKQKIFFVAVWALFAFSANAQVRVAEPEFISSYYALTSDSTSTRIPKEIGELKEHKSKAGLFSKIAGTVSNVAGSVGLATGVLGGSSSTLNTGIQVMSTSMGVESIANAVGVLGSAVGMDIVLSGKASSLRHKGGDFRFVVKAENNQYDPLAFYRVVSFKSTKKERRMQWYEYSPALLGSDDARQKGYVPFIATKYGESSYLITIPATELTKGEYGILFLGSPDVQVATFGVD